MSNALTTRTEHPALATMPDTAKQRGVPAEQWHVLKTVLFKGASDAMVCTLLDYCKARGLDPLKKPFHIVKVWDSAEGKMVESIWPSIGELRTTAMRTGQYAGKAHIEFGEDKSQSWGNVTVTFPEWARCTVYRMVGDQRVEFAGSPVYWLEAYASVKGGAPNGMWQKRPRGQLAKVAEAEALRSAFPEETGTEPTAEEMEGRTIGAENARDVTPPKAQGSKLDQFEQRITAPEPSDAEYDEETGEIHGESAAEPDGFWQRKKLDIGRQPDLPTWCTVFAERIAQAPDPKLLHKLWVDNGTDLLNIEKNDRDAHQRMAELYDERKDRLEQPEMAV